MFSLVQFTLMIRKCPKMYLGYETVTGLFYYLDGAKQVLYELNPDWKDPVFDGFQAWVENRLQIRACYEL